MPLPALAEKIKPALKIVKMAKPFAFCRMLRGMTPSRPLLPLSTNDLTVELYLKRWGFKEVKFSNICWRPWYTLCLEAGAMEYWASCIRSFEKRQVPALPASCRHKTLIHFWLSGRSLHVQVARVFFFPLRGRCWMQTADIEKKRTWGFFDVNLWPGDAASHRFAETQQDRNQ